MKNYRTTLAGLVLGILPNIQQILGALQSGTPIDWAKMGLGLGLVVIGFFAKDFNVSGTGK